MLSLMMKHQEDVQRLVSCAILLQADGEALPSVGHEFEDYYFNHAAVLADDSHPALVDKERRCLGRLIPYRKCLQTG